MTQKFCATLIAAAFAVFTSFGLERISDYTISGTTYTRSEGWLVSDGATVVLKYADLALTGTERLVSWSQSNKTQVGAVGLCSYDGVLKGYWENNNWSGGTVATTELDGSGILVCVYGPNTQGVTAYNAAGEVIFRAVGLRATGESATMGTRFDFSSYVTDVAIFKGAVESTAVVEMVASVANAFNQPTVSATYEDAFLTAEYTKTTIRVESIDDLQACSFSAKMNGRYISDGPVEATGYFATKTSDNEMTVEIQAVNNETKCVLVKLMREEDGFVSMKVEKTAYCVAGTALGTRCFEAGTENRTSDTAGDGFIATSSSVNGYGIASLTISGKNVGDTVIPEGTLKYGYDFNGTSFTKEDAATDSLTAAKSATIVNSIVNGALVIGNNAGSHYGDSGFSYGKEDWSIVIVAKATGASEVIYAMGGQKGTTGLIGLRYAGSNTVEAFTKNGETVTGVTLPGNPMLEYHLYTVVYSGGYIRMNVDGGLFTDPVAFTTGEGNRWQFGGIHGGEIDSAKNASNDQGLLDEFRVYTCALNREQTYAIAEEFDLLVQEEAPVFDPTTDTVATTAVLRFSEIMPKPSDKPYSITTQAGYDKNGLESGWVELENTSETEWANLADYKFIRVNRSKANSKGDYGNFPEKMIAPGAKYVFYTSERYSNSASKVDSAFAEGTFDGAPKYFEKYDMMIWGDKINPKKFPFVRLIYAPQGVETSIIDTVVIPSDIPEGNSIVVVPVNSGEATVRYMTSSPTCGKANPTNLDKLVKLGPNVGPLYEIAKGAKHSSASEFGVTPPAKSGEDYEINFSLNPTMSPTVSAGFREEDKITSVKLIYRTWGVDEKGESTRTTYDPIDVTGEPTWDAKDQGYQYTASIPAKDLPNAGQLVQWKFEVTDAAGNTWTTPSFHNPDDGYEWYGTIVESDALTSKTLPTWHMFVDAASKAQMDKDTDDQNVNVVPHNARVAIYDSSSSNYYDYVRIDLRGNTSAHFTKKSHGLRFAKAHPLTIWDPVAGETREEVRKSSLIGEPADPSFMRQMIGFWLWNKMGNKVPFDFPVRCNLNGAFFQLGFHSERFTDELIEDFHKLDKYGYGYKNVGTLMSTTAGGAEKKTPDDGNESDMSMLNTNLVAYLSAAKNINNDNADLTKTVVERFDLPAWLNYLASARITQEMDDVWANICIYRDSAQMLEGERGTGTWMPLGYDFNVSFGQYYHDSGVDLRSNFQLMSNQDWFKSHPFYGGMMVRCRAGSFSAGTVNTGNLAIESVWQSSKFRRLYLRRLRTLMDQELKAPGTPETEVPFMVKMRELAELMYEDSQLDRNKYGWDSSFNSIDAWGQANWPKDIKAGVNDIWQNYVVPRQTHLYVTHSVTNVTEKWQVGYGAQLNAGIPEAQSAIAELKDGISAEYDPTIGATIIKNTNAEAIDLSGWALGGPVQMTLPPGTVIDQANGEVAGEVYVTADRRATIAKMALVDQVVVGNGTAGATDLAITLIAADKTEIISAPTDQSLYVRLWGFTGAPKLADEDWGEAIVLTNLNQSAAIDLGGMDLNFCGSDKLDTASKCHFVLIDGVTIPAGGFVRIKKTDTTLFTVPTAWDKIANHGQRITIKDKNGALIQYWELVDQDGLGVYQSGLGLKYNYETETWETIDETLSPGWEDLSPEPPPVDSEDPSEESYPADATVYTGAYAEAQTLSGNVVLSNATFAAGLTTTGDVAIYLAKGTENTFPSLTASGALTIDGSGALTITSVNGEAGTAAVTFTAAKECYYIQNKGTVTLNLNSTNQVFGFYAKDLKGTAARFNGGVFNTTIQGGEGSAAFKFNKGSNDVIINGTAITIELGGTAPRFANVGGHIEFTPSCGVVAVSTLPGEGAQARVFKTEKKVKLNGGTITGSASGEGSEMFSADNEINMTGGVVAIAAHDDCFSAATNIVISAGIVHATSTAGDALDSNGSMTISGGHVFAFTCAPDHEALDVEPAESNELEHKLVVHENATVVALGGKQVAPVLDTSSTAKYTTAVGVTMTKKYVAFTSVTTGETNQTTQAWAVNINGRNAGTFTVLVAAPGFDGQYELVKNPGDTDPAYVAFNENLDKVIVKTVVEELPEGPTAWGEVEVSESTTLAELVGSEQAQILTALKVAPITLVTWAKNCIASEKSGEAINLEAFALNCAPEEVDQKAALFKVTIMLDEDGDPIVDTDEGVTFNILPTIKGSTDLRNWHDLTEGDHFFKGVIDLERK